jgi:hypothetical protein
MTILLVIKQSINSKYFYDNFISKVQTHELLVLQELLLSTNIQDPCTRLINISTPLGQPIMGNNVRRISKKFLKSSSVEKRFEGDWRNVCVSLCSQVQFLLAENPIFHSIPNNLKPRFFLL